MQVDYIIVGFGLAGMAFAKALEDHNKTFIVFEDNSQQSSLVAAGFYNPVILKRFTPVWDAEKQLEIALPFYTALEKKFNNTYNYKIDIHRIFTSIQEQNDWFVACDKPVLSDYMQTELVRNSNPVIKAPFGFGKLINTGKIDIKKLIDDYRKYLSDKEIMNNSTFNYNNITFDSNSVNYKNITAKKIVFCEGFGIMKNPFFKNLPLNEVKGELLTIHAPQLKLKQMLKSSVFMLPLGNDLYKVGATFNWQDKTSTPTKKGKEELIDKLNTIIDTPYTIKEHVAGIRPTVKDRRPLLGKHQKYKELAILNGLGTRGVMLAPKMSKLLFNYLENAQLLPDEVTIKRFQI